MDRLLKLLGLWLCKRGQHGWEYFGVWMNSDCRTFREVWYCEDCGARYVKQ